MYGVIHSSNLQIQCHQRIGDGRKKLLTLRQIQFIPRFLSFRWIYLSLLCAIVRERDLNSLQVLYAWAKPVWFFVNVKVCALIMVIEVGNRQMENDLKKDYQDVFKMTNISILCIIFTIKTHSKNRIDARNEFTDLK